MEDDEAQPLTHVTAVAPSSPALSSLGDGDSGGGSGGSGAKPVAGTGVVSYSTLWSVWRPMLNLAAPVLATYLLTFGIPIVTLIFMGHLGEAELAVGAVWRGVAPPCVAGSLVRWPTWPPHPLSRPPLGGAVRA
jgi:hypothetical protein